MKIFTLILLLFTVIVLSAQENKKEKPEYFVFNKKGEPCKIDDASYLGILEKLSDTTWQWKYYNYTGTIINIETYRDKELTSPHGYLAYFDGNGKIDSSGYTSNGRKDKNWYYFNDSLRIIQTDEYDKGVLLERKDEEELKREKNRATKDSSFVLDGEKEASFKAGETGWRKYLESKFKFPDRAITLSKNGTAIFSFTVDTDGSLLDILLVQSVEYSFDEAFFFLLKTSPKWEPALQNGKAIKAYRRQPMTIRTESR